MSNDDGRADDEAIRKKGYLGKHKPLTHDLSLKTMLMLILMLMLMLINRADENTVLQYVGGPVSAIHQMKIRQSWVGWMARISRSFCPDQHPQCHIVVLF